MPERVTNLKQHIEEKLWGTSVLVVGGGTNGVEYASEM
jgi:NADH dehydrogenase FAD-containing subunit